MTEVNIEGALVSLLRADSTITTLLYGHLTGSEPMQGYRIFPDELPQGPILPAVVYFEVSSLPATTTDGPGVETARIQFDAYAQTHAAATAVIKAITAVLCPRLPDGQVGFARTVVVDGLPIVVQGVIPDVRRSMYEHDTKLYRRGRDYKATASAV